MKPKVPAKEVKVLCDLAPASLYSPLLTSVLGTGDGHAPWNLQPMAEQTTLSVLKMRRDQSHSGGHRPLWPYCKDAKLVQGVRAGGLKEVAFLEPKQGGMSSLREKLVEAEL